MPNYAARIHRKATGKAIQKALEHQRRLIWAVGHVKWSYERIALAGNGCDSRPTRCQWWHWVLDRRSGKVLPSTNPAELAAYVETKSKSTPGCADVVMLCKFWNKHCKAVCGDGVQRCPHLASHRNSSHFDGPIPSRIDEALPASLQSHLRSHLYSSPVPSSWTGRPV